MKYAFYFLFGLIILWVFAPNREYAVERQRAEQDRRTAECAEFTETDDRDHCRTLGAKTVRRLKAEIAAENNRPKAVIDPLAGEKEISRMNAAINEAAVAISRKRLELICQENRRKFPQVDWSNCDR